LKLNNKWNLSTFLKNLPGISERLWKSQQVFQTFDKTSWMSVEHTRTCTITKNTKTRLVKISSHFVAPDIRHVNEDVLYKNVLEKS
jgi:hypothetical protein